VSAHHRKSHCRTCIQFSKTSKGHTGTTPRSQPTRCHPHCSLTNLWANNRLANLQLLHLQLHRLLPILLRVLCQQHQYLANEGHSRAPPHMHRGDTSG
jgi:hypothetical protein